MGSHCELSKSQTLSQPNSEADASIASPEKVFSTDAKGPSEPIVNVDSGLPNCRAGLDRIKTKVGD